MKFTPGILNNRKVVIEDNRNTWGCYTLEINLGEDHSASVCLYADGSIHLSETPQYGGEDIDHGFFTRVFEALEEVNRWV